MFTPYTNTKTPFNITLSRMKCLDLDLKKGCYMIAILCFVSLFVMQSYNAVKKFTSYKTSYHVDLKVTSTAKFL